MYIIKIRPNENGSRPPLQKCNVTTIPSGYAWCEDKFYPIFYGTSPAGFVHIVVKNDYVVDMRTNETALNEYIKFVNQADGESEVTNNNGA